MIAMMEKYANNLEVLVDERTDQLQEEKKKTGALWNYRFLSIYSTERRRLPEMEMRAIYAGVIKQYLSYHLSLQLT